MVDPRANRRSSEGNVTQTEQIQQLLKDVVECEGNECVDRIISIIAGLPEDAETHYAPRDAA